VFAAHALQFALELPTQAIEFAPMIAMHTFEFAAVFPLHPLELAAVVAVHALQYTVVVAAQAFQFAPQFIANARDLGFGGLPGLRTGTGFRPDPLKVRLERLDASRGFRRQPLAFGLELLLRARALGVAFQFRGVSRGGHGLIDALLRARFQLAA
jgi:hypothetical protein